MSMIIGVQSKPESTFWIDKCLILQMFGASGNSYCIVAIMLSKEKPILGKSVQ